MTKAVIIGGGIAGPVTACALQRAGIVRRHSYPESPPRVEYELTDKGRDLVPILEAMTDFGRSWLVPADALASAS